MTRDEETYTSCMFRRNLYVCSLHVIRTHGRRGSSQSIFIFTLYPRARAITAFSFISVKEDSLSPFATVTARRCSTRAIRNSSASRKSDFVAWMAWMVVRMRASFHLRSSTTICAFEKEQILSLSLRAG